MMFFLSSVDALFAATVLTATVGLGVLAFLLARSQRPASRVIEPEPEAVSVTAGAHAAEAHGQTAAA